MDRVPGWLVHAFTAYYWHAFLVGVAVVGVWESLAPRREMGAPWLTRWGLNAAAFAAANFVTFSILPVGAVAAALEWEGLSGGVLNRSWQPLWVQSLLAILAIDLFRYLLHASFHRFPWLWRLHQVHHADPDYDLTTGLRFHPVESLLTIASYLGLLYVLRPPAAAVALMETFVVMHGFFAHGNVALSERTDVWLRQFVVTPDQHRVHHSMRSEESRSNYGSVFPWWDRLLGTYRAQPVDGHQQMRIGLEGATRADGLSLRGILLLPFQRARRRIDDPA